MIYTERYQCDSFPKVIGVETHWQQTCRSDTPRALPEFSDVLLVKAMDLWLTGYGNYGNRTSRSLNNGASPKSSTLSMSISVVLWILLFWKRICRYIFFWRCSKHIFKCNLRVKAATCHGDAAQGWFFEALERSQSVGMCTITVLGSYRSHCWGCVKAQLWQMQ